MYQSSPRNTVTRDVIVHYMLSFSREKGRQPSVWEISAAAGHASLSTTAGNLRRMVREGLLEKGGQRNRSYSVNLSALPALKQSA